MALIKCPNCGQDISDKAEKCPHCGSVLIKKEAVIKEIRCEECGTVLSETDEVCPNCGCPVTKEQPTIEAPQKVEVTNVRLTVDKKKKKIAVVLIILVILAAVAFAGLKVVSSNNAKKTYAENYKEIIYLMISGASDAETACNLIRDVWYNTIYEEADPATDKYTKSEYGIFYDDFNTSLMNLMESTEFSSNIKDIKDNQEQVQNLMKGMKNPPEEYEDAYDALKTFYDSYTKLVNLAINPTGNLTNYTSSFNNADTDTLNAYKAAALYMED